MTTPILGISELSNAQTNQYAVVNAAIRALEAAAGNFLTVDLSAGNVALTSAQYLGYVRFYAAGHTVTRTLTLQTAKRLVIIKNNGTALLSVVLGTTTLYVAPGDSRFFYTDGTSNGLEKVTDTEVQAFSTQTGTTYTLALSDAGLCVEISNAGAITLTVPPNSTVAFPIGTRINVAQMGAGQITVAQGVGVTVRSRTGAGLKISGQYGRAMLHKRGTDEWVLSGDISA